MKVVRSYKLSGDVLRCYVTFPVDPDSDLPPYEVSGLIQLTAVVGPDARLKDDLRVWSSGCSRSVLLSEIIRFCETIQKMYQL